MVRPLIAALALAALALAACGRGIDPQTTIRLQVSGDPAELDAYRALIAAYEKVHPGRKVELIPVGKPRDHMAKLATGFAAGNAPELFLLNFRRFGQFADSGALEPLGPYLAARGQFDAADFYAPAVDAFRFRGTLACLPQNVSSLVVYYNRALFRKYQVPLPHKDWMLRDFTDAAVRLTRDTDGDGKTDLWGVGLEPTLIRIAPFVWGLGQDLVNDLERPTMLTLDRPLAMRAMSYVKQLNARFGVVPPLAAHQAESEESRFARGGLGMIFESRRFVPTLRAFPDLDWDVAPFPRLAVPAGALHADGYCMARGAANKPLAADFVAWALSVEGQTLMARSGRTVPSRRAVAESPAFLDPALKPASARVFLDAIPILRRTPNVAVWHEVESKADQLLEEWFYEPRPAGAPIEFENGAEAAEVILPLRDAIQPLLLEAAARERRAP